MNFQIRRKKTDSVMSLDKTKRVNVNLNTTRKLVHFNDIKDGVDQYELFVRERNLCNNYRVIVTINPYCTNILFNPFTEIVKTTKKNGNILVDAIIDDSMTVNGIDGITSKRTQYVANTMYSNEELGGYEYYPGYDIFDNHILRNKSFKVVGATNRKNEVFNTIADKARDGDRIITFYKRFGDYKVKPTQIEGGKHLYSFDDLMTYEDSVNVNLREDNGWFGFINMCLMKTTNETQWASVINNRESGDFIDMYPDRTLYSFTPKYNKYRNRLERNWEIILTYPYANDYKNKLVYNSKTKLNALLILSAKTGLSTNSDEIVIFRTYVRHNLHVGDNFVLWYGNTGEELKMFSEVLTVADVGNEEDGDPYYYFYINKTNLIKRSYTDESTQSSSEEANLIYNMIDTETEGNMVREYRIQKITGNIVSEYYLRKFKPIPNFNRRKENIQNEEQMYERYKFDEYVKNNADVKGFDKEEYRVGFASTIYGDDVSQFTFTEDINLDYLIDNRGRPVSEIFVSILKTSYGNKEWYVDKNFADESVEYSHCFTDLICGIEIGKSQMDGFKELTKRRNCKDVQTLYGNESSLGGVITLKDEDDSLETDTYKPYKWRRDIELYGDVIEYMPTECNEYILGDALYRFNTWQRENTDMKFCYHEIETDDYDLAQTTTNIATFKIKKVETAENQSDRKEGYFYKPHYSIPINYFDNVQQDSHYEINAVDCLPVVDNDMFVQILTDTPNKIKNGDIIYIFDDVNNVRFDFVTVEINKSRLVIKPLNGWADFGDKTFNYYDVKMSWLGLCDYIKRKKLKVRHQNLRIPRYADKVGNNIYLWRPFLGYEDIMEDKTKEHIFANNSIYLTPTINFYLKRQDADGSNDLQSDIFPNDITGNVKKISNNYEYKTEDEIKC